MYCTKNWWQKPFVSHFFLFSPKNVARRCHNTLFVMILSNRQHIYTHVWLFYQLIYPFQWFCNPLMLKIHHLGGIRCDLGTSRVPKLLSDAERRHFQKFPYPIKKTVTNMFLVVVDNIFHTDYRKKCLEFFFQPQHVLPRGQSWTGQV